ncbi:MAG: DHA2 family efflux MFS transporter permease subunit [Chloroflexi bacterium]|nr:MAG: DHA2 family efflux MFS transporter permease subunit [Chloroflexota bacterium]
MSTLQEAAPAPADRAARLDYKWVASGVVMLGAVMVILDQTVVNVALPTLESDFGVSLSSVQWIVTGYTLALASVIPLAGWITDRYGSKRVFIVSQVLFVAGSVLCGLARSNEVLIAFRVLQGLGGGLIMPVGMATLMSVTRPDERGRVMSVLGVPMLIGPVLGPTLGGWLIQAVSWRLIFYLNVPIGIVGVIMALLLLRDSRNPLARREPLDVGGMLLATGSVVGMVYGLSQPSTYGWDAWQTIVPLVGGALLLVVFCLYELRQEHPLIDIRIFRDGAFSAALSLNFLVALSLFGAILLFPLFLQQIQGYSALDAGLVLGAQGLGAGLMMPIAGNLTDRVGARWVVPIGLAILAGSTVWMTTLAADTSRGMIFAMLFVRGLGMGFAMMPSMSSAYVTLAPPLIARATSVANVVQRVASGLGIAIMATVLSARISANLPHGAGAAAAAGGSNLAAAHLPPQVKAMVLEQATKGFDDTFWVAAGLIALAFPLTILLRRALRPQEVRRYALRQLTEGIVLGAAARRLRRAAPSARLEPERAVPVLSQEALTRLRKGQTLLRAGTAAGGLVPRPRPGLATRVSFAVVVVAAVVAMVAATAHGYRTPVVPSLPRAVAQAPAR